MGWAAENTVFATVHSNKSRTRSSMICLHKELCTPKTIELLMRNRDPHRENVESMLAICLPIMTMQLIRESPSASHAMRKRAWNVLSIGIINRQSNWLPMLHLLSSGLFANMSGPSLPKQASNLLGAKQVGILLGNSSWTG